MVCLGCLMFMFAPQLRLYKGRSVAQGCGAAGGGPGGDLDHPYVSTKAVSITPLLNQHNMPWGCLIIASFPDPVFEVELYQ